MFLCKWAKSIATSIFGRDSLHDLNFIIISNSRLWLLRSSENSSVLHLSTYYIDVLYNVFIKQRETCINCWKWWPRERNSSIAFWHLWNWVYFVCTDAFNQSSMKLLFMELQAFRISLIFIILASVILGCLLILWWQDSLQNYVHRMFR